ncbi:hypothetical protein HAX54_039488 [Datura stramonium]|uniref:Uncharacterized protein n=1 Tax=Datura stramonium TaxID=4076 RepID=A0ABS8VPX7_DATST|nr:hypothetical protein [Datura stramonium]
MGERFPVEVKGYIRKADFVAHKLLGSLEIYQEVLFMSFACCCEDVRDESSQGLQYLGLRYMMHALYTLFYLVQCAYVKELSYADFLANEVHRHEEDLLVWGNAIKEMEFLLLDDLGNVVYERF